MIAASGPFLLLIATILFRYSIRFEPSTRLKLWVPDEKEVHPTAPIRSKTPIFEPTRKWIIILLTALLLVLLAMQFYGDEINKWYESIKKKQGF